jgi:hypothetical protein
LTGNDLMARGPATFRQRDLMAAVKAMRMAGFEIARVEVDKSGKIVVVPGKPEPPIVDAEINEWDK